MSKAGIAPWIVALLAGACVCGCHDATVAPPQSPVSARQTGPETPLSSDSLLQRLKASALPLVRPLILHPDGRCRMESTGADPLKLRSHPALSVAVVPPGTGVALRALWNDPDPTFHGIAALALACWEPNAPDVRSNLRALLEQTNSPALRLYAVNAYPLLGQPAVQDFTRALESPHAEVRQHAAFGLGLITGGASNAVPALIRLLQTPAVPGHEEHRHEAAAAAFALRRVGISAWAPVLSVLARASDASARWAVDALRLPTGPHEAESFASAIGSVIGGSTSEGRAALAELLSQAGVQGPGARLILQPLLQDPAPLVRLWACVGWIRTQQDPQAGMAGFGALLQAGSEETRLGALDAAAQLSGEAGSGLIPAIVEQLGAEAPRLRAAAARALGTLNQRPAETLPRLMPLLGEGNQEVKDAVVWAAGRQGAAALPMLSARLSDPSVSIREGAARALGQLRGVEGAVVSLAEAYPNQAAAVRRAIVASLESLAERPIDARGLKGPSLARSSLPLLVTALGDEDAAVRRSAVGALARIGPEARSAAGPLLAKLRDGAGAVRRAAAMALEDVGYRTAESVPILMEILNDPSASDALRDRANRLLLEVDPEANRVRSLSTP